MDCPRLLVIDDDYFTRHTLRNFFALRGLDWPRWSLRGLGVSKHRLNASSSISTSSTGEANWSCAKSSCDFRGRS